MPYCLKLPDTITVLRANTYNNEELPKNLQRFRFQYCSKLNVQWPLSITHIMLGRKYNGPVGVLPNTIKSLILCPCFSTSCLIPETAHAITIWFFNEEQKGLFSNIDNIIFKKLTAH